MAKLYGLVLRTATESGSAEKAVRPGRAEKSFMEELGTGKIPIEKMETELSKEEGTSQE